VKIIVVRAALVLVSDLLLFSVSPCLRGENLLFRSRAMSAPTPPLPGSSQIGVAFSDVIPTHPRLACTSAFSLRLA
jgi:hypothetical protein